MFNSQTTKQQVIRVLHVDDDLGGLQVSKEILMMENDFEVTSVSSVDEAQKELAEGNFDAVVSDYEMPLKNGLEFLKELREKKNQIPFILFTGKGREEVAIKALNLGADGYFNKQGSPETVYGELTHGLKTAVARKKAELALIESQDRFQKAQAIAHVGNWEIDLRTKKISGSDEAFKIYGLERTSDNSLPLSLVQKIVLPEHRPKMDLALEELITKNKEYNIEFKIRRADNGEERFIHSKAELVYNQNRTPIKVSGVIQDITETKEAKTELEQRYEILERVTESLESGLAIISKDYDVIWANTIIRNLGVTQNKKCYQTFNNLDHICPDCGVKQIFEQNAPFDIHEYKTVDSKGKTVWIELRVTPLKDREGKIIAALELAIPMTERKRVEEQLVEEQFKLEVVNEKLQVVGSLARHDVANKLSAAKANAYLLKNRIKNKPELIKYVESIDLAIDQSSKILEFSGLYEKIGAEEPTQIDVAESFNQAVALIPNLGIEVVNKTVGLKVLADTMLRQLFYSLIDNSLRHGKTVTKIEVSYTENADETKLLYEDNGVGITEESKEKIFSGGFTTGSGSGLGLKLVKRMAEAYDWTIKEKGVYGKGAKFEITIPRPQKMDKGNL